jgi:hypothetical protein
MPVNARIDRSRSRDIEGAAELGLQRAVVERDLRRGAAGQPSQEHRHGQRVLVVITGSVTQLEPPSIHRSIDVRRARET